MKIAPLISSNFSIIYSTSKEKYLLTELTYAVFINLMHVLFLQLSKSLHPSNNLLVTGYINYTVINVNAP